MQPGLYLHLLPRTKCNCSFNVHMHFQRFQTYVTQRIPIFAFYSKRNCAITLWTCIFSQSFCNRLLVEQKLCILEGVLIHSDDKLIKARFVMVKIYPHNNTHHKQYTMHIWVTLCAKRSKCDMCACFTIRLHHFLCLVFFNFFNRVLLFF